MLGEGGGTRRGKEGLYERRRDARRNEGAMRGRRARRVLYIFARPLYTVDPAKATLDHTTIPLQTTLKHTPLQYIIPLYSESRPLYMALQLKY